jgi:pSer/pThr/pTyr-binding forkhead associated (FHA) protein
VIVDLSGKDGSGVRINGQRAERMQLSDGDVIELGRAKLKFEMLRQEDIHIGSRHPVEIEG